jgi:superfamily II DNA/RNA helicase
MTAPTFSELGVSPPVVDALAAREIYHTFAIQAMIAEDALAGRDVLAKSPTGSGKTLAFAVTIIERISRDDLAPAALVLVPTRELAVQVTEEFRRWSAPATCGWRRSTAAWRRAPRPRPPAAPTSWWRRPGG